MSKAATVRRALSRCFIRHRDHLTIRAFSSRKSDNHSNRPTISEDATNAEDLFKSASVEEETHQQWEEYNKRRREQSRHSFRPDVDPRKTSIILFPGQGSQFVGMAKSLLDYPNVLEMFTVANKVLGYDLLDICVNGPKSELDKTVHCQPAVFVTALAAVERLKQEKPWAVENCISTAGFSIGEYAALCFAGAMDFEDGLHVVKARGIAMQRASEEVPSGMLTVHLRPDSKLKFALHAARQFCEKKLGIENPVCSVANYLFPESKVIAGHNEALEFIIENSADFGLRRPTRLPVSGAFHTPLMNPAKTPLVRAFKGIKMCAPIIPVHANVTSKQHRQSPKAIYESLVAQVSSPVMWEQTMQVLYSRAAGDQFPSTFEMGPGRQLTTMLRKTNARAAASCEAIEV